MNQTPRIARRPFFRNSAADLSVHLSAVEISKQELPIASEHQDLVKDLEIQHESYETPQLTCLHYANLPGLQRNNTDPIGGQSPDANCYGRAVGQSF